MKIRVTKRRIVLAVIVAVLLLGLARLSPSYSRVSIKGDGMDIEVEKAGFGPQKAIIQTPNASAEATSW